MVSFQTKVVTSADDGGGEDLLLLQTGEDGRRRHSGSICQKRLHIVSGNVSVIYPLLMNPLSSSSLSNTITYYFIEKRIFVSAVAGWFFLSRPDCLHDDKEYLC